MGKIYSKNVWKPANCQRLKTKTCHAMDHSPIRQTFELGKFISTAGKSIINLVKLVEKYRNIWKIQSCEICEFLYTLYYARKSVTMHIPKSGNAFRA